MITAEYTIGDKPRGTGEISLSAKRQEFEIIDDLERFLAYNRNYIWGLTLSGSLSLSNYESEEVSA